MVRQGTSQMHQLIVTSGSSRLEGRHHPFPTERPPSESILTERRTEIQSHGIQLVVDIQCHEVLAESEGLSQALRNLVDNAIKFSQGGQQPPRVEIGASPQGNFCLLWVKDNGIGFDMKYHDRIFEIFQRLHHSEEFPGTGIGLALVRKVMERIGGRAWAESIPGQGATFYLEIPTNLET
jgi:signal transduction histidine kinase